MTAISNPDPQPSGGQAKLTQAYVALGASVVALALLFVFNPYASGYGAELISIFKFATELWKGEDWNHCYLVPFAAAAMVYFNRRNLDPNLIKGSGAGLAVSIFGLGVYWLGFRADNIYLGYASFQVLTAGLLIWFFGWQWFGKLFFPWAFLVFLYPVAFLDNVIAFPLRMVMSQASVTVLNIIGISSIKVGTAILSAPDALAGLKAGQRFSVDVADPCSGIRSLFALMMVSALYGYFTQPGIWRKLAIFACSAPLAIMGNLARILMLTIGTIIMGPEVAIGTLEDPTFFHMLAGYLVFGVALAGLLGIGWMLNAKWDEIFAKLKHSLKSHPPTQPVSSAANQKPAKFHDEY